MAAKQYALLVIVFFIFSLSAYAKECDTSVYLINFFYDENSNLKFEGKTQGFGCFPASLLLHPYVFEIKKDGEVYYSTSFDYKVIYTDVVDGGVVVGGAKNAYKTRFTLVVPYRQDIDGFLVREGQNIILSVDKATFYSETRQALGSQGLFGWVESLLKGLFGDIFS